MKSINFLKDMVLFEGLAKEEITKFIEITQEVFFSQGEIIIKENEAGDTMFIILEGIVEVSKSLALKLGNHVFSENEKIPSIMKNTIEKLAKESNQYDGQFTRFGV